MGKTVWYLKLSDQPKELKIDEAASKAILDAVRRGVSSIPVAINGKMYGLYRPTDIDIYSREKHEEEKSSPEFLEHRRLREKWTDEAVAELSAEEKDEIRKAVVKEYPSCKDMGEGFIRSLLRIEVRKRFSCPYTPLEHPMHAHKEKGGSDLVWKFREAYRYWRPEYVKGVCHWKCWNPAAYQAELAALAK